MKETIEVFGNITAKDIIIYVMAFYWVGRIGYTWYKNMVKFHDKEQEKETLFCLVKENSKKIEELSELVKNNMESDKEYRLRSLSDKLFVCYNSAKTQGYITRRQLENFEANLKIYYELGGNGLVKKKYEPEVYRIRLLEDWELADGKEVVEDETNSN